MAHFYGTVNGQAKTTATRCGSKKSGLVTCCASWRGAIRCEAYDKDGKDWVIVRKIPWHSCGESKLLYDGPIGVE